MAEELSEEGEVAEELSEDEEEELDHDEDEEEEDEDEDEDESLLVEDLRATTGTAWTALGRGSAGPGVLPLTNFDVTGVDVGVSF